MSIQIVSLEPFDISVDGSVVTIKPLTTFQRLRLAEAGSKLKAEPDSYDDVLNLIAPYVIAIDGQSATVDMLQGIVSIAHQLEIVTAVLAGSSLTEEQRKNFYSSLVGASSEAAVTAPSTDTARPAELPDAAVPTGTASPSNDSTSER